MKMPSLRNLASTRYRSHRIIDRFVRNVLERNHWSTFVDVGAGKCPYEKHVRCDRYIPVDAEARVDRPDLRIINANGQIPLDDAIVDAILCTEVLEHLKEPQKLLQEFIRILKPGGTLIMTTPFVWPVHESPNDFFRYTRFGLAYLLSQAGFIDVKIIPKSSFVGTLCQLAMIHMRRAIFRPIVIILNVIGLLADRNVGNDDFPLGYNTLAKKP